MVRKSEVKIVPMVEAGTEWKVMQGTFQMYRGTLIRCINYCHVNDMPVANQDEINRIKYGNMPVEEMSCLL